MRVRQAVAAFVIGAVDGVDAGQLAGQRRVQVDHLAVKRLRKLIDRMRIHPAQTTQSGSQSS